MDVVGHEACGNDGKPHSFLGAGDELNERTVVGGGMKDLHAAIGAIEHMVVVVRKEYSGRPWHGSTIFQPSDRRALGIWQEPPKLR